MYAKLAFRNIRRSLRDYIIYFVTLTLTAALMYSFLALGLSPDILAMTENMSMLTTGILILSALIAFMSSFVIGYAVHFMLGQRKKESKAQGQCPNQDPATLYGIRILMERIILIPISSILQMEKPIHVRMRMYTSVGTMRICWDSAWFLLAAAGRICRFLR